MDLLQLITQIDENLFLYLNNLPHNILLDKFFLFFSFYPWVTWIIIGFVIVLINEKRDKLFIVKLMLALGLAGLLSSGIIKPLVKRPRPDIAYGNQVVIIQEKPAVIFWNNDYAFPSGHAAIAFAGAYIISRQMKKKQKQKSGESFFWSNWFFYSIAITTACSRIYLGKHYPIDVIIGGLLGIVSGMIAWKLVNLVKPDKAY